MSILLSILEMITALAIVVIGISIVVGISQFLKERKKEEPRKEPKDILEDLVKALEEKRLTSSSSFDVYVDAIRNSDRANLSWFATIRDNQEEHKRDIRAVLQGTQAVVSSMVEIKDIVNNYAKKGTHERNVEDFVNSLEYVHDKFAENLDQKKAIKEVISNIKIKHGALTK